MDWELHNGERLVGPCSESDIVTAITAGRLGPPTVCRMVGDVEWRPLRSHPTFAMALDAAQAARPAVEASAVPAQPKQMLWWQSTSGVVAIVGCGIALVMGLAIVAAWPSRKAPAATACPPGHYCDEGGRDIPLPKQEAPAPPPAEEPSLAAKILALPTLSSAVATTKPMMSDAANESSPGATILAIWMWKNGSWRDVGVKDETTFGKIQKDSDAERGKRYCASGSLIEIAAQKFDGGKIDVGLLMDDSMRLFHFMSAGSSGSLVAQSPARFCGVVIGRYDYSNSAGGTGHAVEIVGMFDLPENRKR